MTTVHSGGRYRVMTATEVPVGDARNREHRSSWARPSPRRNDGSALAPTLSAGSIIELEVIVGPRTPMRTERAGQVYE